jgi:4-oxalocrotonate tautomerase
MPYLQVRVIERVFTSERKQDMISKLTETMVEIEGKSLRPATLVTIEEVRSGEWSVGGKALTTQDVKDRQASRLPCVPASNW